MPYCGGISGEFCSKRSRRINNAWSPVVNPGWLMATAQTMSSEYVEY